MKNVAVGSMTDNIEVTTYNGWNDTAYKEGDRVGQLIILPYPKIAFEEVKSLPKSERGTGSYGSTGK